MGGYYGLDRSNSNVVDGHYLRRYLDKALITPGGRWLGWTPAWSWRCN